MVFIPSSIIQLSQTATDDLKFPLTYSNIWCREVNFHVLTNAARYGDTNISSANPSIAANNGISFQDVNLRDIFFMNSAAGSNTVIVAIGVLMTDARKEQLGVK